MLDSFKELLKKPEFPDFPDETNFLAPGEGGGDAPFSVDSGAAEEDEENEKAKPEEGAASGQDNPLPSRRGKKTGAWPKTVAGIAACVGIACLGYYWVASSDAPIPADIPQGDILASLAAAPSAAPPAKDAAPQPKAAPDIAPNPSPPAAQQSSKPEPETTAKQTTSAEGASKKPSASGFGANPFIDISLLHAEASAASSLGLPAIYGSGNRALPEVPRPAVSPELLPSPGEIKTPAAPVGAASAPPSMGGLITKPNGESIAIMGDGTVLSEGDTYKGDRRVTFIGGDGITFDDGNTVPFGQNK